MDIQPYLAEPESKHYDHPPDGDSECIGKLKTEFLANTDEATEFRKRMWEEGFWVDSYGWVYTIEGLSNRYLLNIVRHQIRKAHKHIYDMQQLFERMDALEDLPLPVQAQKKYWMEQATVPEVAASHKAFGGLCEQLAERRLLNSAIAHSDKKVEGAKCLAAGLGITFEELQTRIEGEWTPV